MYWLSGIVFLLMVSLVPIHLPAEVIPRSNSSEISYQGHYPFRGYNGYYRSMPRYNYAYWRGPSSAFYQYNYPFYYTNPSYYYWGGPGLYLRMGL